MVRIVIDSSSDIDQAEAEEMNLTLIPMVVSFSGEEFLDGVNLSHRQFFEKLIESSELPKTSQITEFRFDEQFNSFDSSDELVVITLSSKLSSTFNNAKQAAKKYNGRVFVVDSLNACLGERILIEYAVRLRDEGKSAREIYNALEEKKHKVQLLAVLDTLKYLQKGGRISSLVAFAGELLKIKPVVSVIKGEVKLVGKAIGSKKGNNLLKQMVEKSGGIDFSMPYALGYSGLSDSYLNKYVEDSRELYEGKVDQLKTYMIGSTIGTHVGPNAIAVAFFAK